jgi:peptide/nickel transport system substrate-binding protein
MRVNRERLVEKTKGRAMNGLTRRNILAGGAAAALAGTGLSPGARADGKHILIVASGQDIPNFDPHVATGYSGSFALRNLYDTLVRVEGDPPKIVPGIAASWERSPDGLEFLFHLDPSAKFQDGSPIDAEAVRYSFNRLLRLNKGNVWMVSGIIDENSTQAVDPKTVKVRLLKPFVPFVDVLWWLFIANPKIAEANKGQDDGQSFLANKIAGSGAFSLGTVTTGNRYVFERVPNFWREGGGNLSAAIWSIAREASTQRLQIQRGDAHIALDLQSEDVDALKDAPGVVLVMKPDYRTFQIKMNTKHGQLTDINLRKAISYAFNYKGMLDVAGHAVLMQGPLPDGILGFDDKLNVYRTDIGKAKEYLAKSSAPNGGITLGMNYVSGLEQERRWSLVLLDSLAQLNIKLEVKQVLWPELSGSAASPDKMPDFFPIYETANYADPDNLAWAGYESQRNGNWSNPVFSDPNVDAVLVAARAETDTQKRVELYKKFQELVVADAPDIFGVLELRKIALRDNVKNYVFTPVASNIIDLYPLSLA